MKSDEMMKCTNQNSVSDQLTPVMIQIIATLESFLTSTLRYVLKIFLYFLRHLGDEILFDFEDIMVSLRKSWGASNQEQITKISEINETNKCNSNKFSMDNKNMSAREVKEVIMGKLLETKLCSATEEEEDALFNKEVSLEEVREAFEVFDENKDGFIEADEVQRVLCALGFMEASEIECKGMIKAFDNNGDGKIDFNEFAKVIEDSFH